MKIGNPQNMEGKDLLTGISVISDGSVIASDISAISAGGSVSLSAASGTVTISVDVPETVSGIDDKLDKPSADGTAGQVLALGGNGGTEWVDMSVGDTVNNATITFVQGSETKGVITLNQSTDSTIEIDAVASAVTAPYLEFSSVTGNVAAFDGIWAIIGVKTSSGVYHAVENCDVSFSNGSTLLNVTRYLAADNLASFNGTWCAYYACGSGLPVKTPKTKTPFDVSPVSIDEEGIYTCTLVSNQAIVLPVLGQTDKVTTAELWLTMPSDAVSFTISSVTWIDEPDFTEGGMTYCVAVRWDGSRWLANMAYKA